MSFEPNGADVEDLWKEAIEGYRDECEFADDVLQCTSVDDVLRVLQQAMEDFKAFRGDDSRWGKVRAVLKRIVGVVLLVNDTVAEAASSAGAPGGKAILVGFGVLLTATKGLSERYDTLIQLFSELSGILDRLNIRLEAGLKLHSASKENIENVFVHLLHVLKLATKLVKKNRFTHWVQIVAGNNDMKSALAELDRLTTVETRMTVAENYAASQHILSEVRSLHADHDHHLRILEHIDTQMSVLVDSDIYSWLAPPDPSENHHRVANSRYAGTGAWLLNSAAFLAWKDHDASILWLHGKSGSGKSVICSAVIDDLKANSAIIVAYYYFDFRDAAKQRAYGLLCSLIVQLGISSRLCAGRIRDWHSDRVYHGKPDVAALLDQLRELTHALNKPVYFVIDGIDECPLETRRTEVLPCLEQLSSLALDHVHILLASRPEIDIRQALEREGLCAIDLLDESSHFEDIEFYILHILASDPAFQGWPEYLVDLTGITLREKAGGMFRWVSLQLESLRNCLPKYVQATLDALPKDLGDAYTRILDSVDPKCISDVLRILQCLAFAALPLSVIELGEIFAVDFDDDNGGFAVLRSEYRVRDPLIELLKMCSGLVSVSTIPDYSLTEISQQEPGRIAFAHASVLEYLCSTNAPERYRIDATMAYTTLAQICIATVLSLEWHSPLSDHANRYWATYSTYPKVSTRINTLLNSFFIPPEDLEGSTGVHTLEAFYSWSSLARVYRVLGSTFRAWTTADRSRLLHEITEHPLMCAVAFDFLTQAELLLGLPHFSQDYMLRALHVAVISGNIRMIKMLSSSTIVRNINAPIQTLHMPAEKLYSSQHDLLADSPRTILQVACDRTQYYQAVPVVISQIEVLGILIANGIEINAHTGCPKIALNDLIQGWSPTHHVWCSFTESSLNSVLDFLLLHGADINAVGLDGRTIMHDSLILGGGVFKLFERDPDDDSAVDYSHLFGGGATPSPGNHDVVASKYEQSDLYAKWVLRLLLQHGASVEIQDPKGHTALHTAAEHSDSIAVHLLLEHGAAKYIDVRDAHGRTALHLAASSIYGDASAKIKSLVQYGAEVEARDELGNTPLMSACHAAHNFNEAATGIRMRHGTGLKVDEAAGFKTLLHHEADVNARDEAGQTALHIVASSDSPVPPSENALGVILDLLNSKSQEPYTVIPPVGFKPATRKRPLHALVTLGVELLNRGADVNAQDAVGRTALHILCRQMKCPDADDVDDVRVLLDHGANVRILDDCGRSPLLLAATVGHGHSPLQTILYMLVKAGDNALETLKIGERLQPEKLWDDRKPHEAWKERLLRVHEDFVLDETKEMRAYLSTLESTNDTDLDA